jgi:signal transduction histidine kinase
VTNGKRPEIPSRDGTAPDASVNSQDTATGRGTPDLARLAHELRTPLGAIAALAEIMRDERLGPLGGQRYRSYAADIHDSAAHAMSILAALLENGGGSHPGEGQDAVPPMEFVELDIGELAGGTVSALKPLADRAGVRLDLDIAPVLPLLIADRRSLRQIINNLVSNALKFTPPGGRVVVSVSHAMNGPITLEVADNGDGMTTEELERARAGAVAPASVRRRSGGTGFGLPLVRSLAAASGATLTIDSAPGEGTRITIAFGNDRVLPV